MTASTAPCADRTADDDHHQSASRMRHKCPACAGSAKIRNSRSDGDVTTALYFQCQNVECGMTYLGMITIQYYISPSAMPNPLIELPQPPPNVLLRMGNKEKPDPFNDPDAPPLPFIDS